ncbi:hypothetical protein FIS3754_30480 [Fischerella sp. NIES-3754]|nr:hypothetical protein FIS3754_30480 [Fischerella sp. NIES-3754]
MNTDLMTGLSFYLCVSVCIGGRVFNKIMGQSGGNDYRTQMNTDKHRFDDWVVFLSVCVGVYRWSSFQQDYGAIRG